MKKKLLYLFGFIIITVIFIHSIIFFNSTINSNIVANLQGEIYYTKRVNGINTLFKSDANLQNEKLLYSHKGKGKNNSGYNDNIIDFYYDIESGIIDFIAMDDGEWSIFSIIEGENNPTKIVQGSFLEKTDYLKKQLDGLAVSEKNGSIYLIENGEEKCVKKFYGIYDEKFTGYGCIGVSPNGKYLIYSSNGQLTPFGAILEEFFSGSSRHNYIMELSTGKTTRFIDVSNIQWIMKESLND